MRGRDQQRLSESLQMSVASVDAGLVASIGVHSSFPDDVAVRK